MVKKKTNEIIYMHFTVFDSDGVTPLTGQAGSCTSSLRKNGAASAESVTISEIGSTGRYHASFTPLAVSNYDLEVTCPDDRVIGESYETETNDLDDLATDISDAESNIRGADSDDLKTISDQLDTVDGGIATDIKEILAYLGKNTVYENTYNAQNQHTGYIAYCYDTWANKQTHNKSTGLLHTITFEVSEYGDLQNPITIEKGEDV